MQNTAITFNLISKLLLSDQYPATELAPPAPPLQFEQFGKAVPLPEVTLAKVPHEKAKETYEKLQFEDPWSQQREQNSSWFAMLLEMLNGKLINIEERLYDSLKDKYITTVDEADQATFRQFFSIGQWVASTWGPLIRLKLVEGTFISLNDQGNYNQVSSFAYIHMWQVNQRLLAHRLFMLALQDYDALGSLKHEVGQKVDSDQKMLKIWQLRWKESRQMTVFMPYLRDYQEICREALNDLRLSDTTQENPGEKYHYMSRLVEVEDLIAELRASYSNRMLSTKQQSDFSRRIQDSLNYLASKISFLGGEAKAPREWGDLKGVVNSYVIEKSLKKLISSYAKEYPTEEAFQKYIHAVEEDRLIYAKWLGRIMKAKSYFDWERERGDFKNYRRCVRQLLDIYHYIDNIIHNMMQLQSDMFERVNSKSLKPEAFINSQEIIKRAFLLLRKIDKLRIEMRLGYLKKIKTDINNTEIGVFERILTSFNNKLQRYFMEGNVVDQTLTYSEVMMGSFEDTLVEFNGVMQDYKSYLDRMSEKINVEKYQRGASDFQKKLRDNKEYYPVFFDFESLKKFMDGSRDFVQAIKVFIYNLQRQVKEKSNREKLTSQKMIQEFGSHIQAITDYKERLRSLAASLLEIKGSAPLSCWQSVTEMETTCKLTLAGLYDSFVKYVVSENNRRTSLTVGRVASSGWNKFWRLTLEWKVFDETPEYPDKISSTNEFIQKLQEKVNELESYIKGIKEKSLEVSSPPQMTITIGNRKINIIDDYR